MKLRIAAPIRAGALALAALGLAHVASAEQLPVLPKSDEVAAMLPARIKEAGKIALVTDAHYPTCESFAEDGKTMVGFEPDLWNAMGQVMGVKIDPISIDFAGLIPGISSGRYDMAMECITDRPDREKQVTFVNYSYGAGSAVYYLTATTKIDPKDLTTLCGLKTAAPTGNAIISAIHLIDDYCEKRGKPKTEISEVQQASAVMLGVYAGRYDFALSDAVAFEELAKVAPKPLSTFPFTLRPKTYMGMIVKKDDTELANALLAALKKVVDSGVYGQIWDKWKIGHAKLMDPGINLATTRPIVQTAQ